MRSPLQRRLERLENLDSPARRVFAVWSDDVLDIELERARLRAERGMRDSDTLLLVRWMSGGETAGAAAVAP
jgi:hypothetical protein